MDKGVEVAGRAGADAEHVARAANAKVKQAVHVVEGGLEGLLEGLEVGGGAADAFEGDEDAENVVGAFKDAEDAQVAEEALKGEV